MRRNRYVSMLCLISMLALMWAGAVAQEKKVTQEKKVAKVEGTRYDGRIQRVSKNTSTITLMILKTSTPMQIKYDANTQFTFDNKPGSIDDVKEKARAFIIVTQNAKKETVALRVEIRKD
jgi:hypothetical protein